MGDSSTENLDAGVCIDRQTNLNFLLKDFEKTFDMYMYSHKERSEAMKMYALICTAPFVFASSLGLLGKINLDIINIDTISAIPEYMALIFIAFGIAGLLPFHIFISAHCNTYKMIRYMNNYRLFYYQKIDAEIKSLKWKSTIEKDPRNPKPIFWALHWTTVFICVMMFINGFFIWFGSYLWSSHQILLPVIFTIIFVVIHIFLVRGEMTTNDLNQLQSSEIDSLLKNIQ